MGRMIHRSFMFFENQERVERIFAVYMTFRASTNGIGTQFIGVLCFSGLKRLG